VPGCGRPRGISAFTGRPGPGEREMKPAEETGHAARAPGLEDRSTVAGMMFLYQLREKKGETVRKLGRYRAVPGVPGKGDGASEGFKTDPAFDAGSGMGFNLPAFGLIEFVVDIFRESCEHLAAVTA